MMNHFSAVLIVMAVTIPLAISATNIPPKQTISKAESPEIASLTSDVARLKSSSKFWTNLYLSLVFFAVVITFGTFVSQYFSTTRSRDLTVAESLLSAQKDREAAAKIAGLNQETEKIKADASESKRQSDEKIAALQADGENSKAASELARADAAKATEGTAIARKEAAEANTKADGFRLDIAKAQEEAAKANERAAAADLARIQLEERLADRVLTPVQLRRIVVELAPLKGKTVDVSVFGETNEIVNFSREVLAAIRQAGLLVNTSNPVGGGTSVKGVLIGIKPGSSPEISRFSEVLINVLRDSIGNGVGPWDFDKMITRGGMEQVSQAQGADAVGSAPIRLFIGGK